jgi:hypothetical protein
MVRTVQPERAPVGFVDRVLDRTRQPSPRRLLFPLSQKLPLGVAAAVLLGVLVSLLYRASPELDQVARRDASPPPAAVEAPAVGKAAKPQAPAGPPTAPAAPQEGAAPSSDALHSAQQRERPERSRTESREPVAAGKASEPAPRAKTEANQPVAGLAMPEADVAGRLIVGDVTAAERSLGELVSRSGGWQTGRRSTPDGREVDVSIPRTGVDQFMRELAALGRWQVAPAAESPGDPVRVRIKLVR